MRAITGFIILLFTLQLANSQTTQLGLNINGEATGDQLGRSVSLSADGSRIAIGAIANDGASNNAGHVRIYDWDGSAWVQVGMDIDGEATEDFSGFSVSLSANGNRVAIGAPNNDDSGNFAGHVRVYDWGGTAWLQAGMDIDGEAADDISGTSLSLSANGDRLAIGGRGNDGNGSNSGHVRIYDWDGTAWLQAGMDIDGEAADDASGTSLSLSDDGNRVAIAATGNDGANNNAGHIRIYDWDGTAWLQVGTDIDGEAADDQSGSSVSLSANGNRVAIGSTQNNGGGIGALTGHVRVYDWDGTAWLQAGMDIDGESAGDQSGNSVSLSANGNRLAIGASLNNASGNNAGHVRVYNWDGTAWAQVGSDINGVGANEQFGFSVNLSADGHFLGIGASASNGGGIGSFTGHVQVYQLPCNPILTTIDTSICFGDAFAGYSTPGNYLDTFAASSCDSIRTLNLTVLDTALALIDQTICQGQSFAGFTASGNYILNLTNSNNCDSTVSINLTVNDTAFTSITQSICSGQSFAGYNTTGIYTENLSTVNGCDSTVVIDLTVQNSLTSSVNETVCFGESFAGYTKSDVFIDTFNVSGCDSIRTLDLTVISTSDSIVIASITQGDSLFVGGAFQTMAGTYVDTLVNAGGCDSILTTELQVLVVGIETFNGTSIGVFPNPTTNQLQVQMKDLNGEKAIFQLYTLAGKQSLSKTLTQESTSLLLDLSAGTYLYTITKENKQVTTDKLIIVE